MENPAAFTPSKNLLDRCGSLAPGQQVLTLGVNSIAAAGYLINSLKNKAPNRPICAITRSNSETNQLIKVLGFLRKNPDQSSHLPGPVSFPGWEEPFVLGSTPSIKTRNARIKAITEVVNQKAPLVVASIWGISTKFPPQSNFDSEMIEILIGEIISMETLCEKLDSIGYRLADPVEDPGTYTRRGGILDVYPTNHTTPYRIEFFDDEIESIRAFDSFTQQTTDQILTEDEGFIISPYRELVFKKESALQFRKKIADACDENKVSRSSRTTLLEVFRENRLPENTELYYPFLFKKNEMRNLLEIIKTKDSPILIIIEETECQSSYDKTRATWKEDLDILKEREELAPNASDLFTDWGDFHKLTGELPKINLDKIDLISEELSRDNKLTFDFLKNESSKSLTGNEIKEKLLSLTNKYKKVAITASTESTLHRAHHILTSSDENKTECQIQYSWEDFINSNLKTGFFISDIDQGFSSSKEGLCLLTESDIFGKKKTVSGERKSDVKKAEAFFEQLQHLKPDDFIVHIDHGVGRYRGLTEVDSQDYLLIEYANEDKLYLPVYKMDLIQKYTGAGGNATLHKLGGVQFEKAKSRAKNAAKKLAIDLVALYARRKTLKGHAFLETNSDYREFENSFPFIETPDQANAITNVIDDMESEQPMDRLVCGDVGFGKTEVAIRAAFKCAQDSLQTAVLVPTTILCEQHLETFKKRFSKTAVRVESISRFKNSKEIKKILEDLEAGKVDILIGTHRLLSKDVNWHNLGLIIIDEEQRFGVEHKEKLKLFRESTDVLTLTATPIPRTLYQSVSGLRDLSVIRTPPADRLPIRTYLTKFEPIVIKRAIESELKRGGQVFFLHNRVQTIEKVAQKLRETVPGVRVGVAHGQMTPKQLESKMLSFYKKEFDILVCTTIIESGIDIPSVNTMFIDNADLFGLSQLYQLRGRIGRSDARAYCYLIIKDQKSLTPEARERLSILQSFAELGSGFFVANHDLEIRGAGDLLGPNQSGHVNTVGLDLYLEILQEAIEELQGKKSESKSPDPEIKVPFHCSLSEDYIPNVNQRLVFYKRISASGDETELEIIEKELVDRFGKLPDEAEHLLWLIRLKIRLKKFYIRSFVLGPQKISMTLAEDVTKSQGLLNKIIEKIQKSRPYKITPEGKVICPISEIHKGAKKFKSVRELYFAVLPLLD